ncbi:MAG TPA: AI-2E family transporter [Thermoleophilia bacterium]|nr:AI-2E family transporter [Thermoleophilia bacterium]
MDQDRAPDASFFASPTVRAIVIAAAVCLVILALHEFKGIVGQAVLAYVIALAFTPLLRWLRRHLPMSVAITIIMVLVVVAVGGLLVLTAVTVSSATSQLDDYQAQYAEQLDSLVDWLGDKGIDVSDASSVISGKNIFSLVTTILQWVASGLAFSFLLFFIFVYMLVDAMHLPVSLRKHLPSATYDQLMLFQGGVRRYWVIQTITGLIAAGLDTAMLLVLGVPFAFFLGVLAFITNYIPNIGYFIALVPAMLFAFATGGVKSAVIVFIGYWAFNTIAGSIVAPRLNAERLSIGFTTSMVGVLFWGAVLGPVGGLVAVPLILFVREIVLGNRPENQWLVDLLSSGGAAEEPRGKSPAPPEEEPA